MRIELYYCPGAISFCVHWALIASGVAFDATLINLNAGEQRSPAYRKINPTGQVPAVTIDGELHTESAAILMWLSEHEFAKFLAPPPGNKGRGAWLQWMVWLANGPLPALGDWLYAEHNLGVENGSVIKSAASLKLQNFWSQTVAQRPDNGSRYLLGDQLSTVDLLGAMLMFWSLPTAAPASNNDVLLNYMRRIQKEPSFIETCRRERLPHLMDPLKSHCDHG